MCRWHPGWLCVRGIDTRYIQLLVAHPDAFQILEQKLGHARRQLDQAVVLIDLDATNKRGIQTRLIGDRADEILRLDTVFAADFDPETLHLQIGFLRGTPARRTGLSWSAVFHGWRGLRRHLAAAFTAGIAGTDVVAGGAAGGGAGCAPGGAAGCCTSGLALFLLTVGDALLVMLPAFRLLPALLVTAWTSGV